METLTKAPPITVEQFLNFKARPGYRAELLDGEISYPLGSPILAVEVISPSNTESNVLNKTKVYLRHGAVQVWNVYPFECHVVIHEAAARRVVSDEGSIPWPHPFPALQMPAGEFFLLQ